MSPFQVVKIMSSLYERYGCQSKKELYQKVINKDDSVRDLINFIEYSKTRIENKYNAIKSPEDFFDYAKYCVPPTFDKAVLFFC